MMIGMSCLLLVCCLLLSVSALGTTGAMGRVMYSFLDVNAVFHTVQGQGVMSFAQDPEGRWERKQNQRDGKVAQLKMDGAASAVVTVKPPSGTLWCESGEAVEIWLYSLVSADSEIELAVQDAEYSQGSFVSFPGSLGRVGAWQRLEVAFSDLGITGNNSTKKRLEEIQLRVKTVQANELLFGPIKCVGSSYDLFKYNQFRLGGGGVGNSATVGEDDVLTLTYNLDGNANDWGNFVNVQMIAADSGWFDLNGGGSPVLYFRYNNLIKQSNPLAATFRVIVQDIKDANDFTNEMHHEYFYYHDTDLVLDKSEGWHQIAIPLRGSEKRGENPFVYEGWFGARANTILDPEYIRTVSLEISIGPKAKSQGTLQLANVGIASDLAQAPHIAFPLLVPSELLSAENATASPNCGQGSRTCIQSSSTIQAKPLAQPMDCSGHSKIGLWLRTAQTQQFDLQLSESFSFTFLAEGGEEWRFYSTRVPLLASARLSQFALTPERTDSAFAVRDIQCFGDVGGSFSTWTSWGSFDEAGNSITPPTPVSSSRSRRAPGKSLEWEYTVKAPQSWGGLNTVYGYTAGFWNLSAASALRFAYRVEYGSCGPNPLVLRVALRDRAECFADCQNMANVMVWLKDHQNLLATGVSQEWQYISVPLEQSTFFRIGGVGADGSGIFHKSHINGISLELVNLNPGADCSGKVFLGDLQAVSSNLTLPKGTVADGDGDDATALSCVPLPGVTLTKTPSQQFRNVFTESACCRICEQDPQCAYWGVSSSDCYVYRGLNASDVRTRSPGDSVAFHRVTGSARSGSACDVCKCTDSGQVVDCRQVDLSRGLPFFDVSLARTVKTIDFRGANIGIVEGSFFKEFSQLESIDFRGAAVGTISPSGIPASLKTIRLDQVSSDSLHNIARGDEAFDNVCCARSLLAGITDGSGKTLFECSSVQSNLVCGDCTFEKGYTYADESTTIQTILAGISVPFGDAALLPEFCGELCSRTDGCTHFTWDSRVSLSTRRCILKSGDKGRLLSTKEASSVAGRAGFVSGWVAAHRAKALNASVEVNGSAMQPINLAGYESDKASATYSVVLATRPLRGAVWVTPKVVAEGVPEGSLKYSFFPSVLAFYSESWSIPQNVTLVVERTDASIFGKALMQVGHTVESCDKSFTFLPEQQVLEQSISLVFPDPPQNKLVSSTDVKTYAGALVTVNVLLAAIALAWTYVNRDSPVVRASQNVFLAMIAAGVMVSSLAIVPMTGVDDSLDDLGQAITGDYMSANVACMSQIWLYSLGFTLTTGPLFAKTHRLSKIFNNKKLKVRAISNRDIFRNIGLLLLADLIILISWTAVAPLKYFRDPKILDVDGYTIESVGICRSETDSAPFFGAMAAFHGVVLIYGNYICYTVRRLNDTVLSEGKYVALAMFSNIQVMLLAIPLIILTFADPTSSLFVRSTVVFLNDFTTIVLIFLPKVILWYRNVNPLESLNGSSGASKSKIAHEPSFTKDHSGSSHADSEFVRTAHATSFSNSLSPVALAYSGPPSSKFDL